MEDLNVSAQCVYEGIVYHIPPIPDYTPPAHYAAAAGYSVISVLLPILGTVFVALRFYARWITKAGFWLDDWSILVALVIQDVVAGLLLWGTWTGALGLGVPREENSTTIRTPLCDPEGFAIARKVSWASDWIAVLVLGFTKLSVVFLYRRIFCTPSTKRDPFDIVTKAVLALSAVWTLAFCIANIFKFGTDPTTGWTWEEQEGGYMAPKLQNTIPTLIQASSVGDAALDSLIILIPQPAIWKLQMPIRRKVAVAFVFFLGIAVIAISTDRLSRYLFYGERACPYESIPLWWGMLECGTGIIVACLPMMPALKSRIRLPALFGFMDRGFLTCGSRQIPSQDDNRRMYEVLEAGQGPALNPQIRQ